MDADLMKIEPVLQPAVVNTFLISPVSPSPLHCWRLVFLLKGKVMEVPIACGYLSSCGTLLHEVSVLCPGQILIWVITFCLHKLHSTLTWRHFKACLLLAQL